MAKTDSGDGLILWKLTLRKAETKKTLHEIHSGAYTGFKNKRS